VSLKLRLVSGLNAACTLVDQLAYRPAVVKLTMPLPRWWRCDLAKLSMWLDDRWATGYWSSPMAPAVPGGLCDACHRRSAIHVRGGPHEEWGGEPPDPGDFLGNHPVHTCGWCDPDLIGVHDVQSLGVALADARRRSVGWKWLWRPFNTSPNAR
jgi:hypothetical protein